jgi:tRNA(Glu) U13 pseudouridine synthase TruD
VTAAADGDDLVLVFRLPRGSFATAVLHEVMKTAITSAELADVLG